MPLAASAESIPQPSAESTQSIPKPAAAPVQPVTEVFFAQTVTDPYRYMEDVSAPEVEAYMRAQSGYARSTLDAIPGRAALAQRIDALSQTGIAVSGVQVVGVGAGVGGNARLFYYQLAPGDKSRKLYVREGFKGRERLLFDVQSLTATPPAKPGAAPTRWSLDYFLAAPDGRHVLVGVAAGGSENTVLRVIEVASGRDLGIVIDRIGFTQSTAWANDGKTFFYNRLPDVGGGDAKNRYLYSRVYRHQLGRPLSRDELVLGPGMRVEAKAGAKPTEIPFYDIDIPSVAMSADGSFLVGQVKRGDMRDVSVYVAPATDLPKGPRWRKLVDFTDQVTSYVADDKTLFVISHKDAPRNKVLRVSLSEPNLAKATVVLPQGDTVVEELALARDALYIRELVGGVDRLQRIPFSLLNLLSKNKLEFVRLPFDLAIRQMITHPKRPGALLRLEGWTEAPRYVAVEERSGNLQETPLQPKATVDFNDIDEVRLMVKAKDGVQVPISLMYQKGTTLNSDHPTLLRAYGAYGNTQRPTFNPATLAWLERGGILATCHVRGGGEFGEPWHQAGQKLNKPNTWRDLIACAEFMIERQFTRKEKLAIQGGSAGGIAVGRALTERPDLFAAVVPTVGVLDMLRAEFTPNGPPNIPEFGSVVSEDGFKGLLAMSAFHQVQDGVDYPAVLLMHGVNDPRVNVWHSVKMAARLQAATAGIANANPVLLRLDYDAGHGVGASRSQRNTELADIYAFLLWRFGEPDFQPH